MVNAENKLSAQIEPKLRCRVEYLSSVTEQTANKLTWTPDPLGCRMTSNCGHGYSIEEQLIDNNGNNNKKQIKKK